MLGNIDNGNNIIEKVNKLGDIGQIVNVKPGYARNFFIS